MSRSLSLDDVCRLVDQHSHSVAELSKEVIPVLRKLDKSNASKTVASSPTLLEGSLSNGRDPLEMLDPLRHTVGYLFVLIARCSPAQPDLPGLLPFILAFTAQFNPEHLRLVSPEVHSFANRITTIAFAAGALQVVVEPLRNIVHRLPPQGVLTNLHALFTQVVMDTRSYQLAREVLMQEITDIDTSTYPLKYQDNLLYHYFGGVIAALLQERSRAVEMLETCISAPGSGVSLIQVDAYKKLVLLQLLTHGKARSNPKYTSSSASTAFKNSCGAYIDYATAYASHNLQSIEAAVERHGEVFERDFNQGLIQQCTSAFRRRTIQKLTNTYITLSLADLVESIHLPLTDAGYQGAYDEINSMIAEGEIFGAISHPEGGHWSTVTVNFTDDPEPYNTHATISRLKSAIQNSAQRGTALKYMNTGVASSKDFVQKAYSAAGSGAQSGGGDGVDVDMIQDWEQDI